MVDKKLIRRKVVESCKLAPNGTRFFLDLVEEFGIGRVRLVSILSGLSNEGYIEQLVMCREDTPNRKFICAKYLKDLPASDDPDEEVDEDEDEDDDDEGNNFDNEEAEGMGVPDDSNNFGTGGTGGKVSPADLSEMHQVKLSESTKKVSKLNYHKFNLIYSLSSQIFSLVNGSGSTGIPGGAILNELAGRGFFRVLNRELDQLAGNLSAKDLQKYTDSPIGHLIVVRGVDFSARIKYYRYFSNTGYVSLNNGQVNPLWGEYFQAPGKYSTLLEMEKARLKPLPGQAIIIDDNGRKEAIFYGGFAAARKVGKLVPFPVTKTGKKRGRPRKNDTSNKRQKAGDTEAVVPDVQPDTDLTVEKAVSDAPENKEPEIEPAPKDSVPSFRPIAETDTFNPADFNALDIAIPEVDSAVVDPRIQQPGPTQFTDLPETACPDFSLIKQETEFGHSQTVSKEQPSAPEVQTSTDADGDVEITGSSEAPTATEPAVPADDTNMQSTSSSRWKPPQKTKAFSLGDRKRHKQILQLLDSHDGVYEHGVEFLRLFNDTYREENGSTMDRKTYDKTVRVLCDQDVLRIVYVTFPNMSRQGAINITKSLVLRSEIPNDDPRIETGKILLREKLDKLRKRAPHSISRKTENGNFVIVTKKYKDIIEKGIGRHLKNKDPQFADDRLMKADQDLRKTKKGKRRSKKSSYESSNSRALELCSTGPENENAKGIRRERAPKAATKDSVADSQTDASGKKKRRKSRKFALPDEEDPLVMRTPSTSLGIMRTSIRRFVQRNDRMDALRSSSASRLLGSRQHQEGRIKLDRTIKDVEIYVRVITICRSFTDSKVLTFDWEQITRVLKHWYPEVTVYESKRVWKRGRSKMGGLKAIDMLTDSWNKIFERGYENGEIKLMDPDHLDIPYLVEYWTKKSPMLRDPDVAPLLLESKEEFEKDYIIVPGKYTSSHDVALTFGKSMIAIGDSLASWAMAYPRSSIGQTAPVNDELQKAKTAIKALIATPENQYDSNTARDILTKFNDDTINKAMKVLDAEKSIVYIPRDIEKVRPGRNFMFSEKFMSVISSRVDSNFVYSVSQFYENLKAIFSQNKGRILSSYIRDEDMPCIIDLVSTQQADLIPIRSQQKAVTSSKRNFNMVVNRKSGTDQAICDLVIRSHVDPSTSSSSSSLESYKISTTFGPSNPRPSTITRIIRPQKSFPRGQPCQYLWIGVKGLLSFPIFERLIQWIIIYLTNHPGATVSNVHSALETVISLEEVEILLDWLIDRKVAEKTPHDGYRLKSSWYYNVFNGVLN